MFYNKTIIKIDVLQWARITLFFNILSKIVPSLLLVKQLESEGVLNTKIIYLLTGGIISIIYTLTISELLFTVVAE